MRKYLPLVAVLVLSATGASAQKDRRGTGIQINNGSAGHVVERVDPREVDLAITTRDGKLSLLLDQDGIFMQLTDRALREVERDLKKEAAEEGKEEGLLGRMFASFVRSTVRNALDHGFRYDLSEVEDVRYEDGRLLVTDREGRVILRDVKIDDRDAMEGFSADDARAFAREFRRRKARSRRTVWATGTTYHVPSTSYLAAPMGY